MNTRLKRWMQVVTGLVCAAGSIACAVAAWYQPEPGKRFRAEENIRNVGILKQQDEKDVAFSMINSTDAPVQIAHISTSCTCTRAKVAARNIEPGESTELMAHLRVGNRRGRVTAHIDVLYRIGDKQELERLPLTITAIVEPHYTVTPEDVVFVRGGEGEVFRKQEANITITPKNGPALQILEAYATHYSIRVRKIHPGVDAGSSTINIGFEPARCITTTVQAELVIRTDSKLEPIYRVPIRVVSNVSP